MKVRIVSIVEAGLLLIGVVLAILWIRKPADPYEPYLALVGSALAVLELYRRKWKREQHDSSFSPITVKEIVDTINSAPPYQKAEISQKYNGIQIKWVGYLKEAKEDFLNRGRVRVNLQVEPNVNVGYSFWFTEHLARFPEIRTLKRESRISVAGEIISASGEGLCVDVKPSAVMVLDHNA